MIASGQALPRFHMMICCPGQRCAGTTVAHKGQCIKKWFAANKKDRRQTKKIGCKQKRSDTNKKIMPTKKIGCKQKDNTNKKDRMQTKKIGCKQKTKTCHDASSRPRPADTVTGKVLQTSNYDPEVVMDLADGPNSMASFTRNIASLLPALALSTLFHFFLVCRSFFVCILSFLFTSWQGLVFLFVFDLFCLHPIFFVCSKPFFIALTLVGHHTGQVHFHLITANWSQFL